MEATHKGIFKLWTGELKTVEGFLVVGGQKETYWIFSGEVQSDQLYPTWDKVVVDKDSILRSTGKIHSDGLMIWEGDKFEVESSNEDELFVEGSYYQISWNSDNCAFQVDLYEAMATDDWGYEMHLTDIDVIGMDDLEGLNRIKEITKP